MWGAPFFVGGVVGRGMEERMRSTRGEGVGAVDVESSVGAGGMMVGVVKDGTKREVT